MADASDIKRLVEERYDACAQEELATLTEAAAQPQAMAGPFPLEGLRPARRYFITRKIAAAVALGGLRPGARVLDVGCARGTYTLELGRRGFRMTGVDLSPQSVAVARRKAELLGDRATQFLVADAEGLAGVPDGAFDHVVSFSTLRYVPDLPAALRAIRRVLKPGGVAVLDFPNRWCPWFSWLKPRIGIERLGEDRLFAAGELLRVLGQAGFEQVAARHLLFTPTVAPAWSLPGFRLADVIGERLPLVSRLAAIIMCRAARA